ncbi:MAG: hypothetical protein ACQEQL_08015 [Pseudomonadota bacterium]
MTGKQCVVCGIKKIEGNMTKQDFRQRVNAALNGVANWDEIQQHDTGLTSSEIREISTNADKVFNDLYEETGIKPDLSLYQDYIGIFSENIYKLKVNTKEMVESCFLDAPQNAQALKKIEDKMQKQIDYHERYYSATKTEANSDIMSGKCLRVAASVFDSDSKKIKARNKASATNPEVRRGVLAPKNNK